MAWYPAVSSKSFRVAIYLLLFALSVFAQEQPVDRIPPSCGPSDIQFEVHTSKSKSEPRIEPSKARVYIVELARKPFFEPGNPVIRIGLDGSWMGAMRGNSYFAFSVDPGGHHVCAEWQPSAKGDPRKIGFASFTAEATKEYYFRVRVVLHIALELERLDPDQGRFLVSKSALAVSRPKK